MKKINIEKRYYTNNKDVVVAVAFSDGMRYRAEAKCHPNDVFDYEFGKRLASLRCDMMIMQERVARTKAAHGLVSDVLVCVQKRKDLAEKRLNKAVEMEQIVANDLAALLRAGTVADYEKEGEV